MTVISLICTGALLVYLFLAVLVIVRNPKSAVNWLCAGVLFCFVLWSFEDIFDYLQPPLGFEQIRVFENIGSTGGYCFAGFFLLFALALTRKPKPGEGTRCGIVSPLRGLPWWSYLPIVGFPVAFNIAQWSGLGGLKPTLGAAGWTVDWSPSFWVVAYILYYVAAVALSLYLIVRFGRGATQPRQRRQAAIIAGTALVSLVLGTLSDIVVNSMTHGLIPKLAPLFALIWAAGLVISITRYGLMSITPEAAAKEILATMPDSVLLLAPDGSVVTVNQALPELLGYRPEDLTGRSAAMLFAQPAEFRNALDQILAGGVLTGLELACRTKEGRAILAAISARAMSVDQGEGRRAKGEGRSLLGSVWIFHDVTERKQAEAALQESEETFRALAQNAYDGTMIAIGTGKLVYANERAAQITGYHLTELLSMTYWELGHPDERPKLAERLRKRLRGEPAPNQYDTAMVRKDGIKIEVEVAAARTLWHGQPADLVVFRDITERKQALVALRASEERYRRLFELAPTGIAITDLTGRVLAMNPHMLETLGYTLEDLRNHGSVATYADPRDREKMLELLGRHGRVADFEVPLRRKDGSVATILLDVLPIELGGQRLLLSALRDVTESRRMRRALETSEERYRTLVEGLRDGVFLLDQESRVTFVSSEILRQSCLPASAFLNHSFMDFIPAQGHVLLEENVAAVLRGDEAPSFEVQLLFPSQPPIPVEVKLTPLYAGGQITEILGVARDLTERKKAEADLRASEQRFQQVAENAREWIWEVTPDGLYTYASPVVEEILGYAPEEIVGRKYFYDLLQPDERAALKPLALELISNRQPFHDLVNRNLHKDGRIVWLLTSGVPIFDQAGGLLGYRGADMDITRLKQAEEEVKAKSERLETLNRTLGMERMKLLALTEQLTAANKDLRRLAEAKTEFVASVSHDLRTPLTTIIEGLALAEDGTLGALNEEQQRFLRFAREDAERLSELIANLLDATKIESGKLEVNPVKLDVGAAVARLRDSYELYVQARGLKLVLEMPSEPLYAWCDPNHYHRVLANLLSNAIKFTPAGGCITIRAEKGSGLTAVTSVRDTGVGIPNEKQNRVFVKFEQIRRAGDTTQTGTGLGLTICKQLVELNGGTIRFESTENQGSVFSFALPMYRAQ